MLKKTDDLAREKAPKQKQVDREGKISAQGTRMVVMKRMKMTVANRSVSIDKY